MPLLAPVEGRYATPGYMQSVRPSLLGRQGGIASEGNQSVSIQFVARRMSGGTTHQHIEQLWWKNPANGSTGNNSRAELVTWIEQKNGKAYTEDARGNRAEVFVRTPAHGAKYLQTRADGVWTNNLLALPER